MKKNYLFFSLLLTSLLQAEETFFSSEYGSVDGVVRLYHIFTPAYVKSGRENDYELDGSTIGGHIRYTTPTFSGFNAKTALYYARGTGLNNTQDTNTIMAAGRYFSADYSPKAVLGELNIQYKDKTHHAILGHFKISSPLTNSISTYMPNMFEALLYENKSFDNTTLSFAKVEKMAYGTRTPVEYGLIGEATLTGGATQGAAKTRGEFLNIGGQILANPNQTTNGLYIVGLENKSFKNLSISAWDFYALDIINMFYIDLTYKNTLAGLPMSLSSQYLRNDSIGDDLALPLLDSKSAYLVGLKASIKYQKSLLYLAFNHSGNSKLFNPYGGDPAYTSMIFSRNAYRANVDAYKIGLNYDINKELKMMTAYASYGKSSTEGTFIPSKPVQAKELPSFDAMEASVLFSYTPNKSFHILAAFIYKESEYAYNNKQVKLLDTDLVVTYKF